MEFVENGVSQKEAVDTLHDMLKGTAEVMEDVKMGKQIEIDFEGESVK